MPKGPLRRSIEDAAKTFGSEEGEKNWWETLKERAEEYAGWWGMAGAKEKAMILAWTPTIGYNFVLYVFTGKPIASQKVRELAGVAEPLDLSREVADIIEGLFSKPIASEIVETMGAIITEPVITLFEKYAADPDPDPHEFARAFHGFMIGLNLTSGAADMVVEMASLGQFKGVGKMIESMYWSLGLGFLGWQTLAPLLNSGLQPGLERHYNKLYRPTRFSASELRDLYALGEINKEDLAEGARIVGWREQDISQWIKLAFRTVNQGEIFKAYNQGIFNEAEATKRLRALGYDPADIPLLFQLNPKEDIDELRNFTAGTARQAYREELISEAELRSILAELNYQEREIDLIVGIENTRRTHEVKSLTLGQIKSAWEENVIVDAEARHWLEKADFGTTEIDLILETWKAEIVPEFRKINIGTITSAYVEGILTRNQAAEKLLSVGFTDEDTRLELDLIEARNPEAFGREEPPPAKLLTPGTLSQLVTVGLITPQAMATRLLEIGYSQADANLLSEAARIRALPPERPLPQLSIERAYIAGVITRDVAHEQLMNIGLTSDNANEILDTVEVENAELFGAPPTRRIMVLSPAILEDLFISGLLSQEQFILRLGELGYTDADAKLLLDRALLRAGPQPQLFTQSTIERAYLAGVFTRNEAIEHLAKLDYTPDQAGMLLTLVETEHPEAFEATPQERFRYLSAGVLEDLLIGGLITSDYMFARLVDLEYTPFDADLLTQRAIQIAAPATRVLGKEDVTRAYVIGVIDRTTALNKLVGLDFAAEDAEQILFVVEAENPQAFVPDLRQSTRLPSIEALMAAVRNEIISVEEYFIKAQELGFLPQDAAMYLTIATKNERKSTVTLSASQVGQAYDAGLLSRGISLTRLSQLGYGDDDAILLLRVRKDFVVNTDVWDQMLAGNLDAFSTIAQLVNAQYNDQDIIDAFASLPPAMLIALEIDIPGLSEALSATPGGE